METNLWPEALLLGVLAWIIIPQLGTHDISYQGYSISKQFLKYRKALVCCMGLLTSAAKHRNRSSKNRKQSTNKMQQKCPKTRTQFVLQLSRKSSVYIENATKRKHLKILFGDFFDPYLHLHQLAFKSWLFSSSCQCLAFSTWLCNMHGLFNFFTFDSTFD